MLQSFFLQFYFKKNKTKIKVAWDMRCRSRFSRQLTPPALKSPGFFIQQSRENLSVHGESDDWDLLICSHCAAPHCQSTPPTLTTHLGRALPRSTY